MPLTLHALRYALRVHGNKCTSIILSIVGREIVEHRVSD